MAPRFHQGIYKLKHPEKYIGNPNKIRYMSSWELQAHSFFDTNKHVLLWSSEPVAIPYLKPTDGRIHKYYPDYYVEYVTKDQQIIREIIELKPIAQITAPRKNHKYYLYEQATWVINAAKWKACKEWCDIRGINFRLITEKSVFR